MRAIEAGSTARAGVRRPLGIQGGVCSSARVGSRSALPRVAGVLAAACLVACAGDARADFDFQTSLGITGAWLRQTPSLTSKPASTIAREMGEGKVATGRSLAMVGFAGDVDVNIDDRWRVPLFGGGLSWAVGSYDALITSVDGSIVRMRPWSTFRGDILLPGVGRRWKHRRSMVSVAVRTGVSFFDMGGSIAAATQWVPRTFTSNTFLLQAEVVACRRLDPTTRACLQVVPRLYEYELLNGVTFGLRMEFGP